MSELPEFTLYHHPQSGFCCSVRLGAAAYGVKLNLVDVDFEKGDNLKPEFIKLNPQHQVPTLVADDGWVLTESRAIIQYFANAFGNDKTESLYPRDPKKRALVDQRMYFDMGTLYKAFADAYYGKLFYGEANLDEAKLKALDNNIGYLELFLSKTKYAAGYHVTIADFSIAATVAILEASKHNMEKFPKVRAYLDTCKKEIPSFQEVNEKGLGLWAAAAVK